MALAHTRAYSSDAQSRAHYPKGYTMSNDTLANAAQMIALQEQLDALKAENERLLKAAATKVTVKYNEDTGTVSVYGLQRFPVTLRPSQWSKLFTVKESITNEITPERIAREERDREAMKAAKAAQK